MTSNGEERHGLLQDVPKPEDKLIQEYLIGRNALIDQEAKVNSNAAFRQGLSPVAEKACAIVDRIRDEEKKTVWTPQLEDSLAQQTDVTVYPGMMFSLSKSTMESTKLWRIVRQMPKGALLHAHLDAMVDFHFLLDVLIKTPGIHMMADVPLSSENALSTAKIVFRFRHVEQTEGNIWHDDYKPETLILLTKSADEFPNDGREGFLKWLYSRCVLSTTDAVAQHHGVDEIWVKFYRCFRVANSIIHYEPIFRLFLRRLMSLLKADKVNYVEVRFSWQLDYYRQDSETPESDYTHMMSTIDEEVKSFQASEEGRGFWGIRVIWATIRVNPTKNIIQDMQNCIKTKETHPHLIAGYDLVGQEDGGRPLRDLLPELFWFRKQCAERGLNIPFFFHAGECLGSGSEADHNLYDAILLGTRRIGHGFSLYKHPLLIDLVKEKKILVESCPISNEVLRLCGSVMSHPLPALLARGVACSLCNDDPAMLGQDTAGTTHDFWQALQGWESLGLAGLGSLAENSIRWAAFEDQTAEKWNRDLSEGPGGPGLKGQRLEEWAAEWERYCAWIVSEFGKGDEAN